MFSKSSILNYIMRKLNIDDTVFIWCMACRNKTDSEVIDIVPTRSAPRIIGKCKVCSNATSGFTFKAVI